MGCFQTDLKNLAQRGYNTGHFVWFVFTCWPTIYNPAFSPLFSSYCCSYFVTSVKSKCKQVSVKNEKNKCKKCKKNSVKNVKSN